MNEAQEKAALTVMSGTFKHKDVRQALQRANVPISDLDKETKKLLQREKDLGHIRHEEVPGKAADENDIWVKV